jgi:hypothetical protein
MPLSMPESVRRLRDVPWAAIGPEPLSGSGWGVLEKPDPIAESDSDFRPHDLIKRAMIKRLPS